MRRPATIYLACLIAALAFAPASWAAEEQAASGSGNGEEIFKESVALYQKGDYRAAREGFEKFSKTRAEAPKGELARYYRALCLTGENQMSAAREEYYSLYSKAKDKAIRYRAYMALKSMEKTKTAAGKTGRAGSGALQATAATAKAGPGADAWITPKEGYGRSGPEATSSVQVEIIPTSCGRRHR